MKTHPPLIICVLLLWLAGTAFAGSPVTVERLPSMTGFVSDIKTFEENCRLEANSFEIPWDFRIQMIEWWTPVSDTYFSDFWIRILEDDGGLPGATVYSQVSQGVPSLRDDTVGGGVDFWKYTKVFISGTIPPLEGHQRYWLSIAGADEYSEGPTESERFLWAADASMKGFFWQASGTGSWIRSFDSPPAFRIQGQTLVSCGSVSWSAVKALF